MAANAQDPLEVFPSPVWECILEHLRKEEGCSHDVLNCSKVCTEFERILEPTKGEWLFGSICPFIFPYLGGGELLACRRVCKNWRRGVDNFLEDFETWKPFDEGTSDISRSTLYDPLKEKKIKWTSFVGERRLVKFLEAIKEQEMKTPFVGRSVSLEERGRFECHRSAGKEFLEKALELLSFYGDHIWHLRVVTREDFDSCHFYQIMKQILKCTPNLKSLILDIDLYYPYHNDTGGDEDEIFKLKKLQLEDHPLPEISSLETLEIDAYCLPPVLETLITKINLGNLKCLKLRNSDSYIAKLHVGVTPLQHLSELHVSGIKWADLEHILANMISPTAPVETAPESKCRNVVTHA